MQEDEAPPPLDSARAHAARGWRPFPCEYQGKRPAVGIKWGTATASAPTDGTLRLWFGRDPVNIGLSAKWSGLTFLDDDTGTADGMERLCEAYGQPIPETYRVRTSKGWHWYFRTPDGVEIHNAGRGSYLKDEFGFDVRGNCGGTEKVGGYVVAAGSVHESGFIYEAEDDQAEAAELPDWLLDLLLAQGPGANPKAGDGPEAGEPDSRRPFTIDQAKDYVKRFAEQPLRNATEGGRNNALNAAALVVGHFVPDFFDEDGAIERLSDVAEEIGLDPREIGPTIRSGLRRGMSEPYLRVDEPTPFESASADSGEVGADTFETEVGRKLHELRIADEARRRFARERRAHRPSISEGVIDDLDAIAEPEMLLGSLIPDASVGFLAGRSGAYKSFLATSWACCIATGRAWLGDDRFRVSRTRKTLYVAAEGSAGAAGRIRSWEAANEVSRRGKLLLYPRAIHLNDPAQVEELVEYVVEHEIRFLVVDTFHRSAPGTEENSSTDFGIVFEAAATLRDEQDCSVLFIDHTGNSKTGNPRGTSAKRDDADYVLSASYDGEQAVASTQRELFVTKLKDTDTVGRWPIRLVKVEGETFPVIEVGEAEEVTFATADDFGQWWQAERLPEMPADVTEKISAEAAKVENRGLEAAKWVWRYLRIVDDESGQTRPQIMAALAKVPKERPITPEAVAKAIPLLDRAGVIERDKTRVWLPQGVS